MNYITRVYTVVQVTVLGLTCTECATFILVHVMSLWLICRLWPLPFRSRVTPSNQNVDDEPPSRSASPLP